MYDQAIITASDISATPAVFFFLLCFYACVTLKFTQVQPGAHISAVVEASLNTQTTAGHRWEIWNDVMND